MSFGSESHSEGEDELKWIVDALIDLAKAADGGLAITALKEGRTPPGFLALRDSDEHQARDLLLLWAHTFSNALSRLPKIRELLEEPEELSRADRIQVGRSLRILWNGLEPIPA